MKFHIICQNYLNKDGEGMSIGGIQTYITNLVQVLSKRGIRVIIHQRSNKDFGIKMKGSSIFGYTYDKNENGVLSHFLYRCAKDKIEKDDIIIFASDTYIIRNVPNKTIAIQHGVSWDKPEENCENRIVFNCKYLYKAFRARQVINRIRYTDYLVCVDYNFLNWYRALVPYPEINAVVIPNFTAIPYMVPNKTKFDRVSIIFARRFFKHRGTRLFGNAISRILQEYDNVNVIIAGEGPDENWLHDQLDKYEHVKFIKYESSDSLRIHVGKDIAIVPTTGSEGTSLSLLEAMAAKCAVICSNVGGMTNIIIDQYNGLVISPNEDELYDSIKRLIENPAFRRKLAEKAQETAANGFSLDIWEKKWNQLIDSVILRE